GILDGLRWLALDTGPADVRVFHYSGHGSYLADQDGDERHDGRDECLVPVDYDPAGKSVDKGMLRDDDLAACYGAMDPRCNLTLLMDSCHSGTVQKAAHPREVGFRFIEPPPGEDGAVQAAIRRYERDRDEFTREATKHLTTFSPE